MSLTPPLTHGSDSDREVRDRGLRNEPFLAEEDLLGTEPPEPRPCWERASGHRQLLPD